MNDIDRLLQQQASLHDDLLELLAKSRWLRFQLEAFQAYTVSLLAEPTHGASESLRCGRP
jgi:hypothetical protein